MTESEGRVALQSAGIEGAARDAQKLWQMSRGDVVVFAEYIARRAAREPVSRIGGTRAFWEHDFLVTLDVLDPRPDTETLVELALNVPFRTVLDLGTGSGCIIASLLAARPDAQGTASDISQAALAVAGRNADLLGVRDRLSLVLSDWFSEIAGRFDLIVSNPPYIPAADLCGLDPEVRDHDPEIALSPGADGLAAYRVLAGQAGRFLNPGATILVECGFDQADAVRDMFDAAGFGPVTVHRDLAEKDRVVAAKWPKKG